METGAVRAVDGSGLTIYNTGAPSRSFNFKAESTGGLEIRRTANTPAEGVQKISTESATEDVVLLEFTLKAKDSNVEMDTLEVEIAGNTTFIDTYIQDVFLTDGTEVFEVSLASRKGTFELDGYEIKKDVTKTFTVYTTVLKVAHGQQGREVYAKIADKKGIGYDTLDNEVTTDRAIEGLSQHLYYVVPSLELVSGVASWVSSNVTDGANVVIEFKVTAVGGNIYIPYTDATIGVTSVTNHFGFGGFTTYATGNIGIDRVSGGTKHVEAISPITEFYKVTEGNSAVFELYAGATNLGAAGRATVERLTWFFEDTDGNLAAGYNVPWTGDFVTHLRTNRL